MLAQDKPKSFPKDAELSYYTACPASFKCVFVVSILRNRQVVSCWVVCVFERNLLFFLLFAGMTSILCYECAEGLPSAPYLLLGTEARASPIERLPRTWRCAFRPWAFRRAPHLPDPSIFHVWAQGVHVSVSQNGTPSVLPSQNRSLYFAEQSTRHDEPLENPPQAAPRPLSQMSTAGSPQTHDVRDTGCVGIGGTFRSL